MAKFIKKESYETTATTLIGQGMKIEANLLSGSGIVRIEGEYFGEIDITGELILERTGYIKGNVKAKIAYISGNIAGNIKCAELLHITSTGKVTGDIESEAILMDEGAIFIGYSKMVERNSDPLGIES